MNNTKLSVVMPVYNAEKYLEAAIQSILHQTYKDFEFIIVDDASTDKSPEIIKSFEKNDKRIKILTNNKNLNIGGSLNKGIESAQGKYIARMDADDIAMPDRFELQIALIQKNDRLAVVGGDIQTIDARGENLNIRRYPTESNQLKKVLLRYMPFAHPATIIRKSHLHEFGGYDPSKSPSEDMDLWIKLGSKYEFGSTPNVILKYRVFENSFSNRKLRSVELNTLKMRWDAVFKYGYRPGIFDILYNTMQFITLWFMTASFRIKLFNWLRNKRII